MNKLCLGQLFSVKNSYCLSTRVNDEQVQNDFLIQMKVQRNGSLLQIKNEGLLENRSTQRSPLALRSHDAGLYVLIDTLVVVMELVVIRSPAARVEGRDSVQVENELFSVAHGS